MKTCGTDAKKPYIGCNQTTIHMTMNELSDEAKIIRDLANANLGLLTGRCQTKELVQDYYLGIIRRQAIVFNDLSLILKNRNPEYITSPYMLLRGLMDDFLHLIYLELHYNREEEIIKINAKAIKENFSALKGITESNHNYFNGQLPYYLNNTSFEALKIKFAEKAENAKYFDDVAQFKFKKFQTFTDMVGTIAHSREVGIFTDRAFFLWKLFSDFIHFSNFTFDVELSNNPNNVNFIVEAFQYSYNSLYLAFKYFERSLDLVFIEDEHLTLKHEILYKC